MMVVLIEYISLFRDHIPVRNVNNPFPMCNTCLEKKMMSGCVWGRGDVCLSVCVCVCVCVCVYHVIINECLLVNKTFVKKKTLSM